MNSELEVNTENHYVWLNKTVYLKHLCLIFIQNIILIVNSQEKHKINIYRYVYKYYSCMQLICNQIHFTLYIYYM